MPLRHSMAGHKMLKRKSILLVQEITIISLSNFHCINWIANVSNMLYLKQRLRSRIVQCSLQALIVVSDLEPNIAKVIYLSNSKKYTIIYATNPQLLFTYFRGRLQSFDGFILGLYVTPPSLLRSLSGICIFLSSPCPVGT